MPYGAMEITVDPQDWVRIGAPQPAEQAQSLLQQIKSTGLEARRKTLPEGVVVLVRREKLAQARELLKPPAEPEPATTGARLGLMAAGVTTIGAFIGAPVGFLMRGTALASVMVSMLFAFCAFLLALAVSSSRLTETSVSQATPVQTSAPAATQRPRAEDRRKE